MISWPSRSCGWRDRGKVLIVELPIARIHALAEDATFIGAVSAIYAALERRIEARCPLCINRGDCCKFDTFGHNLFVTPVELAYFISKKNGPLITGSGTCPFQQQGRCTARQARPMGCRIFFCEVASQAWQGDETEATLGEIKALHSRFELPYAYVEWLEALRQLSGGISADRRRARFDTLEISC